VRPILGATHLAAGNPAAAEIAYREDLKMYPHNGWSLFGLTESLRRQGRAKAAVEVEQEWRSAWSRADVALRSSWEVEPVPGEVGARSGRAVAQTHAMSTYYRAIIT
jgi:hypothetical protein